jgi:hypothetical protein
MPTRDYEPYSSGYGCADQLRRSSSKTVWQLSLTLDVQHIIVLQNYDVADSPLETPAAIVADHERIGVLLTQQSNREAITEMAIALKVIIERNMPQAQLEPRGFFLYHAIIPRLGQKANKRVKI